MKNILIYAPVRTGRTWLSRRIKEELGFKGTILVVDEIFEGDTFKQMVKDFFVIGIGYDESSPEQEHEYDKAKKDPSAAMGVEWYKGLRVQSEQVKKAAEKYGFKYFDESKYSTADRGKVVEQILEYVKKSI